MPSIRIGRMAASANTLSNYSVINENVKDFNTVDGINDTFVVSLPYVQNSLQIYLNGQVQTPNVDFNSLSTTTFEMIGRIPRSQDEFRINYIRLA